MLLYLLNESKAYSYEKKLDEIWGCETPLYYPKSHAGTTDLCGVYDNEESIIDFKSSTKTKKTRPFRQKGIKNKISQSKK